MTQILLLENQTFLDLDPAEKELLEKACLRIPGIKTRRIALERRKNREAREIKMSAAMRSVLKQAHDSVFVVSLRVPEDKIQIEEWLSAILSSRPLAALCSFCFVLYVSKKCDSKEWLDSFWIEILDRYSDIAVPSSFVVYADANSRLQMFRIVESISSLCREIDSLSELGRLDEKISCLEDQLHLISDRISQL